MTPNVITERGNCTVGIILIINNYHNMKNLNLKNVLVQYPSLYLTLYFKL